MNYFQIVLQQILIFVIYAGVGALAARLKILTEEGLGTVSKLIMKILLPVMIFTNTINGATRAEFFSAIPVLYVTVFMYVLLFLLSLGVAVLFHLKGNEKNVFRACTMFGNIGFMGIPIAAALFPAEGMLYVALFTIIDQLLLWTLGLYLTKPVTQKEAHHTLWQRIKPMINPATVGVFIAITAIMLGLSLPSTVNTALTKMGAATTPLAMIYLGALFYYTNITALLKRKEIYAIVLAKMCIFPLLFFIVLNLIPGLNEDIIVFITILSCLPPMTSIPMFAKAQHSAGEYAAGYIFITTVCSILTLPFVCMAISYL